MVDLKQGDCLELMKEIPDKSIDMILCDLPYGTTACKWDNIIPFEPLWEQYNRIIKADGAIVLFGSQPFTTLLISSNIKNFKYEWIWEKQKASNFMGAKYQPLKYHENICVFSNSKHNYYPQRYKVLEIDEIENMKHKELKELFENRDYDRYGKVDRRKTINNPITNKEHIGNKIIRTRSKDDGYRYPKSVLKINKEINTNLHPTQKPTDLLEYLIKTYTKENDLVLDNCMGSGSTGVACVNTNRNFIGIELDENYFNIAKARIEETNKE
ncbi:MAG: site-specific DNA-methyltransferase [Methanobrevibacter sp.]|nr:site-specific DNA-methyltransferase [Methanobrevibacter sp.]MBO7712119.1 site-specific DNA-methyltransferase [Methanobrevibacter sp.]